MAFMVTIEDLFIIFEVQPVSTRNVLAGLRNSLKDSLTLSSPSQYAKSLGGIREINETPDWNKN
jgi:hypothetical protein